MYTPLVWELTSPISSSLDREVEMVSERDRGVEYGRLLEAVKGLEITINQRHAENTETLTITAPDATTTYSGYIFVEGS